jgi:hypothetical protein
MGAPRWRGALRVEQFPADFRRDDIAAARTGRGALAQIARDLAVLPGPLAEIAD